MSAAPFPNVSPLIVQARQASAHSLASASVRFGFAKSLSPAACQSL